ncbi:hypothetical protein BDU57DRAFT_479894 [Ampelomyces quisqualis]|uniref:Uncharacterized protein n=1 Tax=Ampelomyces quisqualis TaxID=50730 RepID=A0A6A5QD74_AMPQU|nr:hypothetical protein BDU57DRAFT_479894 [Ampelomyces quisqualis]
MTGAGVNLATTKDGGSYNKLQRPTDYLMPGAVPPPKNALSPEAPNPTNPSKRKREQADPASEQKRSRTEQKTPKQHDSRPSATNKEQSRDTESGMRTMLPGLDDHEYSSDDGTSEALTYLRNVRSEASTIPNLLVASTLDGHENTKSDQNAIYREGTWIAVDGHRVGTPGSRYSEENNLPDPQDRQCQLLLERFHSLRATLATIVDDPSTLATLSNEDTPNMIHQLRRGQDWAKLFDKEWPKLEFMAQLDQISIYRALDRCTYNLERARSISAKFSCWIWTLLASTEDIGTLNNYQVGRIRDLGQKAVLLATRLRNGGFRDQMAAEENGDEGHGSPTADDEHDVAEDMQEESIEEYEESLLGAQEYTPDDDKEPGELEAPDKPIDDGESSAEMSMSADEEELQHDEEGTELERARARLLAQLGDRLVQPSQQSIQEQNTAEDAEAASQSGRNTSDEERISSGGGCDDLAGYGADLNTRAAIDMILTIVAEYFGQKDLLKYRQQW